MHPAVSILIYLEKNLLIM